MPSPRLRIGTRASQLAIAQAESIRRALYHAWPELAADDAVTLHPMTTTGDRRLNASLSDSNGKGLFTKEIEDALLEGEIDMAVHSMKDMPAELPDGLEIACIPVREDPCDALLSPFADTIAELPEHALVGTSSTRRRAQLLALRPDLNIVPFRGNVTTRMKKLAAREVNAILLAVAGLKRLGIEHKLTTRLSPETFLPAPGQGALCLEIHQRNLLLRDWLPPLHCPKTTVEITAERALIRALGGSCHTPVGALATVKKASLTLQAQVTAPDGHARKSVSLSGAPDDAEALGCEAGEMLKPWLEEWE